jgi:Zn-dependent M28 family amino/carboxypeptidase
MKNERLKFVSCALALAFTVCALRAEEDKKPLFDADYKIDVQPPGFPEAFTFKAKNLFKHADYLASDECEGRLAGSEGEAKAREYIIKHLETAGFKEVRHFPFDFISDVKLGENNHLVATFPETAAKIDKAQWFHKPELDPLFSKSLACNYKPDEDYRPLRISKAAELVEGGLVFAGYGISAPDKSYDDYKDLDVKGKVVLVIRGEPETKDGKRINVEKADPHTPSSVYADLFYKAATARDKGAAALVIVNGTRGLSNAERAALETFQHGSGKTDCGIPLIQVFPEVADDWLRAAEKDIPKLQATIDTELKPQSFPVTGVQIALNLDITRERATDENLAVVIPGNAANLHNEIIVIGAHYDHLGRGNEFSLAGKNDMGKIHRGADDNASGVSSVLELAEALNKNRGVLKRTVWIMFFGAEELGTLGSIDFVKNPPADFRNQDVSVMLNLDMVGRCRDNKVMIQGVGTGTGLDKVLEAANHDIGLELKPTTDGFGGSDQQSFLNASIPVLFFFTGSHQDYHKPSDSADKLDTGDQARITALVYNTAATLINAPERPKYIKVQAPKMSAGIGGVSLGTLPDYAYEGKGMRINDTRAGGPADKAGLKSGDIIIKLSDKSVENIYDFMNVLRQCQPGIETTVRVIRSEKEIDIKITPEKR